MLTYMMFLPRATGLAKHWAGELTELNWKWELLLKVIYNFLWLIYLGPCLVVQSSLWEMAGWQSFVDVVMKDELWAIFVD